MEELIRYLESEIGRLSKNLKKCKSRWLQGYVDGLGTALKEAKKGQNNER